MITQDKQYDVVLANGRVIDPETYMMEYSPVCWATRHDRSEWGMAWVSARNTLGAHCQKRNR